MLEQRQGECFRLVGDDAERQPHGLERVESFDDAREKNGVAPVLCGVVIPEAGQRLGRWRRRVVGGFHGAGQHALDEIRDATSDIAADRLDSNLLTAEVVQHGVGGGVQIEDSVEQRAVEIDENGTYGE